MVLRINIVEESVVISGIIVHFVGLLDIGRKGWPFRKTTSFYSSFFERKERRKETFESPMLPHSLENPSILPGKLTRANLPENWQFSIHTDTGTPGIRAHAPEVLFVFAV